MTKAEAAQKLCPLIINAANPNTGDRYHSYCYTDHCMAWRWAKTRGQVDGAFTVQELPPEEWTGYCGLAGKPVL